MLVRNSKLAGFFLYIFLLGTLPALAADPFAASSGGDPATTLSRLVDAEQSYAISFLWFDRLAEGHMSFVRDSAPGRFRAVLEAKTLGAAAWLTGDRVQRYETLMEWTPQGRLRPLEHRTFMIKNKGGKKTVQTKLYTFKDGERCVEVQRIKDGEATVGKTIPITRTELPDDFLTAFINFYVGVYGPVREGGTYMIPTLTRKGETVIEAEILAREKWPKLSFFPRQGLLLKVTLDPEVLDTGGGAVYALLNAEGLPERGIVENVLGMGDVRGVAK